LQKRILLLLFLFAPISLQAQYIGPPAALVLLGEWHLGFTQVPSDLNGVATDGPRRALGVAFPLQIAQAWHLRFRYDDGLFSGTRSFTSGPAYATATTSVKQRQAGLDVVYSPGGDRWTMHRPYVYAGTGVGIMQTWHERTLMGYVAMPGLPPGAEEETWSPVGRVFLGIQVCRSVALEAQFQSSTHRFEGVRYTDACATLGLRVWPAMLFARDASARPD
jgi:hypothetical protein